MKRLLLCSLSAFSIVLSSPLLSAEPSSEAVAGNLEVNNGWNVFNTRSIENPIYVTIRSEGSHWEIDGLYNSFPRLLRSQKVELFMATRDLQQWKNAYVDMINNCDDFEVKESDYQSVCTSGFGEKKVGRAVIGTFFGGDGKVAFGYNAGKVAAAIHSIRPEQAQEKLTAFEKSER